GRRRVRPLTGPLCDLGGPGAHLTNTAAPKRAPEGGAERWAAVAGVGWQAALGERAPDAPVVVPRRAVVDGSPVEVDHREPDERAPLARLADASGVHEQAVSALDRHSSAAAV